MKRYNQNKSTDTWLEERLAKYDRWIREGKVPFSSKVIPVGKSLVAEQWVLPTEQAIEILRNARSFALKKCECRSHYQRCDNPIEVCFVINDAADKCVAEGNGRHVSLEEAINVLRQTDERGLVHLTIYNPDQYVFAICSCCSCCCHDLQALMSYRRRDLIAHSEYIAQTNIDVCTHCGHCIERCVFGARVWKEGRMYYNSNACYGCGLCVTICPADACNMQRRTL